MISISQLPEGLNAMENWSNRVEGYMSTPVVINDHAYMHLKNQRFACINLKTGKEVWRTSKVFGKYWSLVAQNDRILALDEKGILYLIKANPQKFDLIDSRNVSDQETWAHLVVCGETVFVRELEGLAAFTWNSK